MKRDYRRRNDLMTDTDTSAEAVEAFIQGPIKEGVISEGLPRTADDTATDYKTVDLLRALLTERDRYKAQAEQAEKALAYASMVVADYAQEKDIDPNTLMAALLEIDAVTPGFIDQIAAEPTEPRQPTVQEAARVLLQGGDYLTFAPAFSAMDQQFEEGPEVAFAAALRALAEGDNQ